MKHLSGSSLEVRLLGKLNSIMPEENEKQKYHVRIEWQRCHGNNLTGANWATLNLQSAA